MPGFHGGERPFTEEDDKTKNDTGKVALVTGASGKLGPPIARGLAECGADEAVHWSRNLQAADLIKSHIIAMGRNPLRSKRISRARLPLKK